MARIEVAPAQDEPRTFDVDVDDRGTTTRHRVTVPDDLADVGLPQADPQTLVRESVAFLLEREPPSAILSSFSLDVIADYFPDYPDEISRRLG